MLFSAHLQIRMTDGRARGKCQYIPMVTLADLTGQKLCVFHFALSDCILPGELPGAAAPGRR